MSQEIRFTRAGHAALAAALGLAALAATVACWVLSSPVNSGLVIPSRWCVLIPAVPAAALLWLAWRLARQPWLVFSSIGLELHDLLRPEHHIHLFPWSEIHSLTLEEDHSRLHLTLNSQTSGGVIVSLAALTPRARLLLHHAVLGQQENLGRLRAADPV